MGYITTGKGGTALDIKNLIATHFGAGAKKPITDQSGIAKVFPAFQKELEAKGIKMEPSGAATDAIVVWHETLGVVFDGWKFTFGGIQVDPADKPKS